MLPGIMFALSPMLLSLEEAIAAAVAILEQDICFPKLFPQHD